MLQEYKHNKLAIMYLELREACTAMMINDPQGTTRLMGVVSPIYNKGG